MTLLDRVAWPLTTDRLELCRVAPADAEEVFAYRSRADVARWITRWSRDLEVFTQHWSARDRDTVVVRHEGVVVGDLMLRPDDPYGQVEVSEQVLGTQAELGYVFDPAHAGRGFATESVRALLDQAFGPIGLRRVVAHCFADNTASWRLMERIGMRREAHTRADSLHRDLGWVDGCSYAVLAAEWGTGSAPATP